MLTSELQEQMYELLQTHVIEVLLTIQNHGQHFFCTKDPSFFKTQVSPLPADTETMYYVYDYVTENILRLEFQYIDQFVYDLRERADNNVYKTAKRLKKDPVALSEFATRVVEDLKQCTCGQDGCEQEHVLTSLQTIEKICTALEVDVNILTIAEDTKSIKLNVPLNEQFTQTKQEKIQQELDTFNNNESLNNGNMDRASEITTLSQIEEFDPGIANNFIFPPSVNLEQIDQLVRARNILRIQCTPDRILHIISNNIYTSVESKILMLAFNANSEEEVYDAKNIEDYKIILMSFIRSKVTQEKVNIENEFKAYATQGSNIDHSEIDSIKEYLDGIATDYSIFDGKVNIKDMVMTTWPSILAPNPFEVVLNG